MLNEFNLVRLGEQNIYAVVDYYNDVGEVNELDNVVNESIDVKQSEPVAVITSPTNHYQTLVYNTTQLAGYGADNQDGYIDNASLLNWTSSIDGYLGNGSSLIVNLSLGEHIVTLSVTDSDGNVGNDSVGMGSLLKKSEEGLNKIKSLKK